MATNEVVPDDIPALVELIVAPVLERRLVSASLEGARRDGALAALELLPKLLAKVATQTNELRPDSARLLADLSDVSGPQYLDHTLNDLCRVQWPAGFHIKIIEVFKVGPTCNCLASLLFYHYLTPQDMALSSKLLRIVVGKGVKQLTEVDLEDLPG